MCVDDDDGLSPVSITTMTPRRLAALLFWVIIASILLLNMFLVLYIDQLENEPMRELFRPSGYSSLSFVHNLDVHSKINHESNNNLKPVSVFNKRRPSLKLAAAAARIESMQGQLPVNYTLHVADSATVCATKNETSGMCSIAACHNDDPTIQAHYGHGAVLRERSIRGTSTSLSGRARDGSGCAMSHKYKFIYIHVLKSGGMTVKAFLKKALCGTTQMPCPSGKHVLEIVDCSAALRRHPEYFVFSFVRNPYSRLYSGYSMAVMYGKDEDAHFPEHPRVSFEEFALQRHIRKSVSRLSTSHYAQQSSFLFNKANCPAFDFLGRLEHFDEDLMFLLQLIGSPELQYAFQNGTLQHEQSTAFGSRSLQRQDLAQVYYASDEVMQSVALEYARDFNLLGYDNTAVPRK